MQIRDLTNFEELTVPEASKVIGGLCISGDAGTPPPRIRQLRVVRSYKSSRP